MFRFVNSIISLLRWLLCSAKCEPLYVSCSRYFFSLVFFPIWFVYIFLFSYIAHLIYLDFRNHFSISIENALTIYRCAEYCLRLSYHTMYVVPFTVYTQHVHIYSIFYSYMNLYKMQKKEGEKKKLNKTGDDTCSLLLKSSFGTHEYHISTINYVYY